MKYNKILLYVAFFMIGYVIGDYAMYRLAKKKGLSKSVGIFKNTI